MFKVPDTFSLRDATTHNTNLDFAYRLLTEPMSEAHRSMFTHKGRWMGQLALPEFQRPLVWDEERKIKFVESAWLGISLGNYVVNDTSRYAVGMVFHPLNDMLVDGQQRMEALRCYFLDEFPVFGAVFSKVPEMQRRRLLMNTIFTRITVHIEDEARLREVYNRLAFGGLAHTEEQRA